VISVRRLRLFAAAAALLWLAAGAAAQIKIPPSPSQWLTDTAGFLSPSTADALNAELRALDEKTGSQVLVYIGRTTEGVPLEDFAAKAFAAWKPGRKGLDDGLIIFIMADDRKIKIETGYGLEERIPDITAGRIINDIMAPRIRAGDNDGAVRGAVEAVTAAISGDKLPATDEFGGKSRKSQIPGPVVIIVIVIFLLIFIKNPGFALWLLFNILGGGGRGGGGGFGGGGGGFSGGGGRSGGGGASGGW
jgi:uncharacterized protein